ncbi:uncharacterized protein LOC112504361 [Cynara cardunculus var. scolymus]|uniref:uncharacterized protein LOC112504361 n=1 Tax=Cynara cardunculus var. scolymus TaxID=59895 RepID=UPI000D62546E|nr:uncharacterized protein LOC112504361 [Cynara cardunculus var. scolymus]
MEHAFQTQSHWESSTNEKQKGVDFGGEEQTSGNFKGKGRGKSFTQIKCLYCDKLGHTIKFCRKRIFEENKTSNFIRKEDSQNDDTMFMMLSIQEKSMSDLWYLDNGCSNHMTGNKDLFLNLEESKKKDVRTGDDKKLIVYGNGDISIKIRNKDKRISDVFYVPGLKHNLLSVGQLILKGYRLVFKDGCCEVTDSTNSPIGRIIMTSNKMFPIRFDNESFLALAINVKDTSLLWHKRFGHVNLNTLSLMHKHELVKGLPFVTPLNHICEACV